MFQPLILSLFVISGYCQNSRPTYTLYNNREIVNATYINIFYADFPRVDYLSFNNGRLRCFNGVWLPYTGDNYNGPIYALSAHPNICIPSTILGFRSLRVIGDPANYSTPALSLFTNIGYINDNYWDPPVLRLEDDPDLGGKYASFILNGNQPITLYSATNFTGLKLCVFPKHVNEIVTIVANVEDLGIPPDVLKSFRFGCHSKNIARITNDPPFGPEDELVYSTS